MKQITSRENVTRREFLGLSATAGAVLLSAGEYDPPGYRSSNAQKLARREAGSSAGE